MKWIFSLMAIFVLNINFVSAQEHWAPFPINEGEGGQIINELAVSKTDPNFIMFGTDVGGLYRSTDGGGNWIAAGRGLSSLTCLTLQIDPSNSNRVFMVGSSPWNIGAQQNGIWMSKDKGITFSQVLRDDNNAKDGMYERLGEQLVIDGSSFDAVKGFCTLMYYTSATGTFYISTDGGTKWNASTGLKTNPYSLAINNSTGDIFAWYHTELFRSKDKGASFQKIYTGIDWVAHVRNVGSKTYMVVHHDKVYVSTDNGDSFIAKGNNGWPSSNLNSYVDRFEVSPANTNNMTLLVNMDVRYYSQDGGDNWAKCDFTNLGHSLIDGSWDHPSRAFVWHPTDGNIAWDTRHDFVTKSFDGGKSYKWSNKGYSGIFLGQGNSFHFNSQNSDYLALPSNDWNGATTYDYGKTWNDMSINGKWWGWTFSPYAVSPGVWFFADAEDNSFKNPVLKITRDNGKTYESHDLAQGRLPTASSYLDPTDINVWFYNSYRSTDAGHTWNGTDKGVVVVTHDNKTNALYGYSWESTPAGWAVFKSTDKGATFQKVFHPGGGDLRDIAIDNVNNFIYVCHDWYVEKYDVTAGKFVTLGAFPTDQYGGGPSTRSVAVDPVDPKIVYVANGGHFHAPDNSVLRSRDGGATWESLTPSARNNNLKYAADNGGKGAVDALWVRVNPKTREAIVGTNDFGFWKIGAPSKDVPPLPLPPLQTSLVNNPSFEADSASTLNPQGWNLWSSSGTDYNVSYTESSGVAGPAHWGTYYGVHHSTSAWKQVNIYQNLYGLTNGTYHLSAFIKSSAAIGGMYVGRFDSTNNYIVTDIPISSTWKRISIDVTVRNGLCEIGFTSASTEGNQFIAFDDVSFTLNKPSYAINAGGEGTGKFMADSYVLGGNIYTTASAINVSGVSNAAPATVYQSERWGPSTYSFPTLVAGQSYTVRLHFAEISLNQAGIRKFNVDINGIRQLTDFDIFATAGGKNKAIVKEYTIAPDLNKEITIDFTNGSRENAKISGIEVFPSTTFSGYYKLTAKHSGKVLDVSNASTANGATVQQWTSNGTNAQKWLIENIGGGYYTLKAKCSGKVLDVSGGPSATGNGVKIQQWEYVGGDNQKWRIDSVENGYYKITAKHSGKCLDVNWGIGALGDGAWTHQWDYVGADNQKWALYFISTTGAREAGVLEKQVLANEDTEPALSNFVVYPNPSNGFANISYTAAHNEQIAIYLYDTQGRLVKTIFTGAALEGVEQNYPIDGSSLKEGLYIIKLNTPSNTINKKLIFNK